MKKLLYIGIMLMFGSCGPNESESSANESESAVSNESDTSVNNAPDVKVCYADAYAFAEKQITGSGQRLISANVTKNDGSYLYYFMSAPLDMSNYCIMVISEHKLEIISTNCGDTYDKQEQWKHIQWFDDPCRPREKTKDMSEISGTYVSQENMDKDTSEIMFHVTAPQDITGYFKTFTIELNCSENYKESSIKVVIDPRSIHTANKTRDESIKGKGFLESETFPEIQFNSNQIIISDTSYTAVGLLSMAGIEKALEVHFLYKGIAQNEDGEDILIFKGAFSLDRTNFGMKETSGIGNNVKVSFYTELVEKK